jgi:hypothetical protein
VTSDPATLPGWRSHAGAHHRVGRGACGQAWRVVAGIDAAERHDRHARGRDRIGQSRRSERRAVAGLAGCRKDWAQGDVVGGRIGVRGLGGAVHREADQRVLAEPGPGQGGRAARWQMDAVGTGRLGHCGTAMHHDGGTEAPALRHDPGRQGDLLAMGQSRLPDAQPTAAAAQRGGDHLLERS